MTFLYTNVYGQLDVPRKQWRFGLLAGRPVAGKIFEGANTESASGLVAGLDLSYDFEKVKSRASIHFQPAFVTFKMTKETGQKNSQYYIKQQWKWEAIHLPLSFRYTLPTGIVRPFLELGFNFRFRTALAVSASGTNCGIAGCIPVSSSQSVQNIADKDKLGILAGAGVEIDAGKVTIPLTIRLVDGIAKKRYDDPASPTTYSNLKTKLIQVTAGVTL
ncbi:MAG: hypothetical protein J7619_30965 [Dyadobacter sp.]|uniref:outer membrane beta-barrel protein n=1 Tax=Dyadobacter sp. TaxID=1914288 RepID=UPI001B03ED2B|nr:outer membrane beta-barrel protein [Dyadobacter sp.]MBO9617148.1 hypothetical protein [Dyadobacter sp.]